MMWKWYPEILLQEKHHLKLLERLHYSQQANSSCVGDSAGCVIAGNLPLTGHHYWLEEQLSAGHFGTDLNHSRYTKFFADGAHLLTCMIGGFEDFCGRLETDFICGCFQEFAYLILSKGRLHVPHLRIYSAVARLAVQQGRIDLLARSFNQVGGF